MTEANITVVEFLHKNGPYQVGDIAGFNDVTAKRLIDRGFAKMYEGPGQRKRASLKVDEESPSEEVSKDTEESPKEDKQMTATNRKRTYTTKAK